MPADDAPRPFSSLTWPSLVPLRAELCALDDALADPRLRGSGSGYIAEGLRHVSLEGDPTAILELVAKFLRLDRAVPCVWAGITLVLQEVDPETEAAAQKGDATEGGSDGR